MELAVVVVVLFALTLVVVYNLIGASNKARVLSGGTHSGAKMLSQTRQAAAAGATGASMNQLNVALRTYCSTYKSFPADKPGLEALVNDKVIPEVPKDGWGREIEYQASPDLQRFKLISGGPDTVIGTADDISTDQSQWP